MSLLGNPNLFSTFPTDTFSGDGLNKNFTLSVIPAGTTSMAVYVEGKKINAKDYYLTGSTLSLVTAPPYGSFNVEVVHFGVKSLINAPADGTISISKLATDVLNPVINSFIGDGSTTTFTLNSQPPFPNSLMVTVNGSVVYNFTVSGTSLTFVTPPSNNADIKVVFRNTTTGSSAVPDGAVSTTKLANGLLVNISPGSVGLPAISVLGSLTTGIYSPSSNSIGISINGSSGLVIDSSRNVTLSGTGAIKINSGSTAARPSSPVAGMIRFNNETFLYEGYNGTSWGLLGGAALSDDNSSNVTQYIGMSRSSSGAWITAYTSSSKLSFNPSTGTLTSNIFSSTAPIGTAPFTVQSTTKVTNLNADLLDGYNTDSSSTPNTVVIRNASGNFGANIITATLSGNASSSTITNNISGGSAGQILYQSGTNVTSTISAGTAGQVLKSNGVSAPYWADFSSSTSSNLTGGVTGALPYQSSANVTAMLSPGVSGQVLTSNGNAAPSWTTLSTGGAGASLNDDTTTDINQYIGMSRAISGDWSAAYISSTEFYYNPGLNTLTAPIFRSTAPFGNSPMSIVSSTLVSNLNSDLLDGEHGSYYLNWNNITSKPDPVITVNISGAISGYGNTTLTDVTSNSVTITTTLNNVSSNNVASNIVTRDIYGNFSANIITADISGNSTTSNSSSNIIGGSSGSIPYQSSANVTTFIENGSAGQVLTSDGSSAPYWSTMSAGAASLSDDTSTNSSNYYLTMSYNSTSGVLTNAYVSSTKLFYNPADGVLNAVGFNSLSDVNKKTNINTINDATNIVRQLNGVEFDWKDNGKKSAGVIAQELEKILPHLVDESNGVKSVNYSGIIGYLIETVKDMDARIKVLENAK